MRRILGYDDGFTLVETLVALALLAMMSGLFLTMVSQFRNLNQISLKLDVQAELNAALDHIAKVTRSARQLPLLGGKVEKTRFMIGTKESIRLIGVVRTGSDQLGLREVEIFIDYSGGHETPMLMERQTLRRTLSSSNSNISSAYPILDGVTDLQFSYSTSRDNELGGDVNNWNAASSLPAAVRISLSFIRGGISVSGVRYVSIVTE